MKTLADINRQPSPRFSLEECLEQLFGTSPLGDDNEIPYINSHEDGFYDGSLKYYLPIIIHWFINFCQASHGSKIFDQSALDYIRDIGSCKEQNDKSILPDIRKKFIYLAWKISKKPLRTGEQLREFYTEVYKLWNSMMLREAEITWYHTWWSHRNIIIKTKNMGNEILAEE